MNYQEQIRELEIAKGALCGRRVAEAQKIEDTIHVILAQYTKLNKWYAPTLHFEGWGDDAGCEFYQEIGYRNEKEQDRMDFGSSFYIKFNFSSRKLTINRGTMGDYGVDQPFQVQRDVDCAAIWINYEEITAKLSEISLEAWKEIDEQIYKLSNQIDQLQRNARDEERATILASIQAYKVYFVANREYNFLVTKGAQLVVGNTFTVAKVTDKKVKCIDNRGHDFQIDREVFINLIQKKCIAEAVE